MPPCETPCPSHAVFRSHGDHKEHGEGSSQSFKKPLCTLCLRAKLPVPPMPFSDFTEITKDTERIKWKTSVSSETLCTSVPPCETHCPSHGVFRSHGDHRGHGGGSSQSVEKPLCTPCLRAKLPVPPMPFSDLTEITKNTERGAVKASKNLCALCASVRNSLYLLCRFQISRRSQRTRRE